MRKEGCYFVSIYFYIVFLEKDISIIIFGYGFVCIFFIKNNFIIYYVYDF